MKRIILALIGTALAAMVSAQTAPTNCEAFRTGRFAYRDSANNIIQVTRRGDKQQEEDKKNKIVTKFKIKWTGDCEYELTQIWSNSKARRKQNRSVLRIIISKVNGDESYDYTCACKAGESKTNNGTMVRME